MSRWYRAYEGTVTDAKLGEAALIAGCSRSVSIAAWHCILESAATKNNSGSFETTPRRVAVILCEPPTAIDALFAAFVELKMIDENGVTSWKRRQFESDSSTERSRKHRGGKRNADATLQQQEETPPETDTDTEESVSNETHVPDAEISEEGLALKPQHLQEAWNAGPGGNGAVSCRRMGPERRRKSISFLRRYSVEDITEAIAAVARSDFLCGRGKENFRADIEFLFSPKHMNRLLEGFYDR